MFATQLPELHQSGSAGDLNGISYFFILHPGSLAQFTVALAREAPTCKHDEMTARWHHDARWRLILAFLAGLSGAAITILCEPGFAPLIGWATAALTYCVLTWTTVGRFDAEQMAAHASAEAPGAIAVHTLLVLASLGSLAGIGMLIWHSPGSRLATALVSLLVIVSSWLSVQTVHTMRYARAYFADSESDPAGIARGIDFHTDAPPSYSDFAYVAFTVGMSFAISDTDLSSTKMRRIALPHALLAYLFGTVFVAALVNILASLSA